MIAAQHPRDPRSRAVTEVTETGAGAVSIRLECGHIVHRRPLCCPSRVICRDC